MAKKRKRRSGGSRRGRRTHRRRRGGGGAVGGIIAQDAPMVIAGGIYGFAERKAKTEADFFLNKVPRFIDALGFAGNTALAAYAAWYFTKNKWARLGARAIATVASYQMARKGESFKSKDEHFTVSGYDDEHLLGDDDLDELEGDVEGDDDDDIGDDSMMGEDPAQDLVITD